MFYRFLVCIPLLLLVKAQLFAQLPSGWHVDTYTEENGLTNSLCKSVDFDEFGNAWIGTDNGVFRFNGQEMQPYRDFPSKYVKAVFTSSNGETFVTTDKGLLKLNWNQQSPSFQLLHRGGNHHLDELLWYPKQVFELSDGSIWITDNKGLLRINGNETEKFELPEALHPASFSRSFQMLELNESIIAISQKGQCFVYDGENFNLHKSTHPITGDVHAIASSNTNLLVASNAQLKLIEHPMTGLVMDSVALDVSVLRPYKGGYLAGTWNNGLKYIHVQNKKLSVVDIDIEINGAINEIKSQGHQIWLATNEGCIVMEPYDFIALNEVQSEKGIVEHANGRILAVVDEKIIEFDPKLNQQLQWKLFDKEVSLLRPSQHEGCVALLSDNAFVWLDKNGKVKRNYTVKGDRSISTFILDHDGELWWAENNVEGAFHLNTLGKVRKYGASDGISVEPLLFQLDAEKGDLWIGAEGNSSFLYRFHEESSTFQNYSNRLPIDHHIDVKVNDLEFNQGRTYVATQFGLFELLNKSLVQVNLGKYKDSDIHGLKVINERIWFGASEGLICKIQDEYLTFDRNNGIPSKQVSYSGIHLFNSDDLWVSTPQGLGFINALVAPALSPVCGIRSISSNNIDLDLSNVTVSSDDALRIDFSNSLPGARRAQYQYRIAPGDSDWQPCSKSRGIILSNLNKGSTAIELRSKLDGNFIWSSVVSFPIKVSTVWYKRWSSIALFIFLIFGIAALSVAFFSQKQRRENEYLNSIVLERTQELEEKNKELEKAREAAEVSNLAKSDFLSTMTHEIRTPMNAVIGMTNLLQEEDPSEKQKEKLDILAFSANNLLKIINDILDLNKIEVNKVEIENTPLNLKELIDNLMNSLEPTAKEQNNRLITNFTADNHWVLSDSTRLSQVLINLVNNAIKFTKGGTIELNVKEEKLSSDASKFYFKVSDTGIGIPEDKHDSIFESFSQASSSTTREFGGTGLGLPISKKLVELMGGDLRVKSVLNEGSEFYFELDFLVYFSNEKDNANEVDEVKDLSGVHILLTEDNAMNVAVVSAYLERWGASFVLAENGQQALDKVTSDTFDLVLMDIHMPVMDGYEATKRIRQLSDDIKAQVPIIALTASAMVEIQREVSQAGMDAFVSKPFDPDDLYNTITSLIEK